MILADKLFCYAFVLLWQWLCSLLFADVNINQFTIHHNEIKDTLLSSMKHMHMYRLGITLNYITFTNIIKFRL